MKIVEEVEMRPKYRITTEEIFLLCCDKTNQHQKQYIQLKGEYCELEREYSKLKEQLALIEERKEALKDLANTFSPNELLETSLDINEELQQRVIEESATLTIKQKKLGRPAYGDLPGEWRIIMYVRLRWKQLTPPSEIAESLNKQKRLRRNGKLWNASAVSNLCRKFQKQVIPNTIEDRRETKRRKH